MADKWHFADESLIPLGNIGICAEKKRVNREIFLTPLSNPNEGSPPQGRSAARRGRLTVSHLDN
jgi:hypothetical protein